MQPESKKRIVSITFSPHIFHEAKKLASLVTLRDVTNIRKMEEDVMKATKLESISIFAGGIAHDFNNILTIMLGNLSLTKMLLTDDDNIRKRLDKVEMAAIRAKDLTQQLLMFSKEGVPVKKISSIKELIEESVNFSLTGSKIVCETLIPDDIWALEIDEGQISQSINNLIINAIQAMPEGGRILFSVRNIVLKNDNKFRLKAGHYVRVSIEDEGIGIPAENLNKIFDPYFTTKEKGNGLGLSSVYSIINKHDGAISVESTVGIGTKFNIYLPANPEVKIEHKTENENVLSGEGKILVMDDEEDILEVAEIMLKNLGYDVVTTKNGNEALELYKSALANNHPFNVVIMDLTIRGGMGGKHAIKKLLMMDPQAKVIVSSGYSNDPTMANYMSYGFKGLIMKPFKMKDLWKTLKNVIEST
jgi:two-component system cell cycle sensor histidine kinase/response regulator CckA